MAHHCPDCGGLCYCDGEDCCHDMPRDILKCTHYTTPECDAFADEDYDDYDGYGYADVQEQDVIDALKGE